MTRVRRRVARDRHAPEVSAERLAYFAWHADWTRRRVIIAMHPDHPDAEIAMAEAIRHRRWSNAEWDRLRAAGMAPDDARREMQRIPPWVRQ